MRNKNRLPSHVSTSRLAVFRPSGVPCPMLYNMGHGTHRRRAYVPAWDNKWDEVGQWDTRVVPNASHNHGVS
jgi:hypothetical protein